MAEGLAPAVQGVGLESMKLLWLRRAEPLLNDRELLAALPAVTVQSVEEIGMLSGALADGDTDAVFASGRWSTADLIQVFQETHGRGNPIMVVLLPAEEAPRSSADQAPAPEQLQQAIALAQAGIHRVLSPETPIRTIAAEIHEAGRAAEIARSVRAAQSPAHAWSQGLAGASRAMYSVMQTVELVGQRRCTVLITGETGTGKEMVARAVHAAGPRAAKPWVPVNCTALPDTLLEAELFGHTKGAFTGAVSSRVGRFEEANQGTIFLDEIGDMPLDLQAKLLRVLQEREIQRIGSSETIAVDVRVVAATNVNLQEKVAEGKFREDLFYRLNVVPISIPPLRERTSDIPLLTQTFIEKICRLEGLPPKKILQEAMHHLCTYDWPGNVRQLENSVEMAVVLSGQRQTLLPGDFRLPKRNGTHHAPEGAPNGALELPEDGLDFEATVSALERALLRQALDRTRGNKRMAAELLRLKRTTLTAKIKSLEMAS